VARRARSASARPRQNGTQIAMSENTLMHATMVI